MWRIWRVRWCLSYRQLREEQQKKTEGERKHGGGQKMKKGNNKQEPQCVGYGARGVGAEVGREDQALLEETVLLEAGRRRN